MLEGPDAAARAARFAARVPASYREGTPPGEAALDIAELAALSDSPVPASPTNPAEAAFGGHHRLAVRPTQDTDDFTFRIRRYGEHAIELSAFLPILESFGLVVVESVPYRVGPGAPGEPAVHIDDVGVRVESPHGPEALRFVPEVHGPRLVAALEAVARGETEVDSLNRLVTVAGLDWRQVTVLRAYLRYWLQGATSFSAADLADPLVTFPDVARALIGYFQARFDPACHPVAGDGAAQLLQGNPLEQIERARCMSELDLVPQLRQDQVLRGYLRLIDATVRTNYFQVGFRRPAPPSSWLSSSTAPWCRTCLLHARGWRRSFTGPAVEGVHLRAGLIARGGLRWSERPSDFRTEVLDLAFAQVKKNAIIVPTGAKGGFVHRRLSPANGGAGPDPGRSAALPTRHSSGPCWTSPTISWRARSSTPRRW